MDMQTVLISYFISALICAAVMASLWRQNRKHFDGLGFWLADYALQFIALPLVLMQGELPDFISMTIGNGLGVAGTLLLYIGLERFVGKRSRQFHNYVILAVFLVIHTWFIFGNPSLMARKINVSAALIVLIVQSAWLMLRRVDAELRPITRGTGLIFLMSIAVNLARIYVVLATPSGEDFFGSNIYETVLLMTYQMLMIGLTFNLFAMVNRRLSMNLQDDIENRKRAEETLKQSEQLHRQMFLEHSAVRLLIDPSTGAIVQANAAAAQFYGYTIEELQAMNIAQINELPLDTIISAMQEARQHKTDYFTFQHRLASGEIRDVEVHSAPINVGGRELLYSIIHDITERKRAEEALVRSQQMYQDLVERQGVGVYRIRVQKYSSWGEPEQSHYEYEFVNDEYCRLTGASREEHFADPTLTLKLIHPEDYPSFAKKNEEVDLTNEPFVWEGRMIIHGNIRWTHYESRSRNFPDIGEVWTGILMDITNRKQAESKLRASEERFSQLIISAPDAVFLVEPNGKIAFANTEATNLLGYTQNEFIGMDVEKLIPQPLRESHMSNRAKYMDDPRTRLMGAQRDLHTVRKDGSEMPVDVKLSPVRMETGMYVVAFMRDITERKQVEEELHAIHETLQAQFNEITKLKEILQEQAIRDPLTNLHNRRYLNEMLGHEAARAKRENYPIGIMLIDIDHFKAFNDTYGHSAGDEVLRSLSHLLVDGIRQGDIACRYGGEEFLVVMIGAHETDVERRAETICRDFNKLQIRFEDQILSATVSIGVAFFPRHGVEIQQVIGTADAAMYQAKLAGRNRVQVWRTE